MGDLHNLVSLRISVIECRGAYKMYSSLVVRPFDPYYDSKLTYGLIDRESILLRGTFIVDHFMIYCDYKLNKIRIWLCLNHRWARKQMMCIMVLEVS